MYTWLDNYAKSYLFLNFSKIKRKSLGIKTPKSISKKYPKCSSE